jgi:hypothetical protein
VACGRSPVLCDAAIAPWPEWLREALAPPAPMWPPHRPGGRGHTPVAAASIIESRVEGILRFVFGAPIGERNARLFWAACRVRDMVHGDDLAGTAGNRLSMSCARPAQRSASATAK